MLLGPRGEASQQCGAQVAAGSRDNDAHGVVLPGAVIDTLKSRTPRPPPTSHAPGLHEGDPPVTDVVDAPTAAKLQSRLEREQAERRLPSVVAGLVRDGELVWWGAAGT